VLNSKSPSLQRKAILKHEKQGQMKIIKEYYQQNAENTPKIVFENKKPKNIIIIKT
jgi:hypothetical protein